MANTPKHLRKQAKHSMRIRRRYGIKTNFGVAFMARGIAYRKSKTKAIMAKWSGFNPVSINDAFKTTK